MNGPDAAELGASDELVALVADSRAEIDRRRAREAGRSPARSRSRPKHWPPPPKRSERPKLWPPKPKRAVPSSGAVRAQAAQAQPDTGHSLCRCRCSRGRGRVVLLQCPERSAERGGTPRRRRRPTPMRRLHKRQLPRPMPAKPGYRSRRSPKRMQRVVRDQRRSWASRAGCCAERRGHGGSVAHRSGSSAAKSRTGGARAEAGELAVHAQNAVKISRMTHP